MAKQIKRSLSDELTLEVLSCYHETWPVNVRKMFKMMALPEEVLVKSGQVECSLQTRSNSSLEAALGVNARFN